MNEQWIDRGGSAKDLSVVQRFQFLYGKIDVVGCGFVMCRRTRRKFSPRPFWACVFVLVASSGAKKLPQNRERPLPPDHHHAEPEHSKVLTITAKNLDDHLAQSSFLVVLFYAPWCGHCKQLAPHYTDASVRLQEEGLDITMAKVDMNKDENTVLAKRYSVRGYPSIKIFKGDDPIPWTYRGPRDAGGIVNHLTHDRERCNTCGGAARRPVPAAEV